jgi:hypothetical protein
LNRASERWRVPAPAKSCNQSRRIGVSRRKSVLPDWDEATRCIYDTLGEVRTEINDARRIGAPPHEVAIDAMTSLREFLTAIEQDFGGN